MWIPVFSSYTTPTVFVDRAPIAELREPADAVSVAIGTRSRVLEVGNEKPNRSVGVQRDGATAEPREVVLVAVLTVDQIPVGSGRVEEPRQLWIAGRHVTKSKKLNNKKY